MKKKIFQVKDQEGNIIATKEKESLALKIANDRPYQTKICMLFIEE